MITLRLANDRFPSSGHLFEEGNRRRLCVVLDTDSVDLENGDIDDSIVFAGLLASDDVEVYRFSDRGVPKSAEVLAPEDWDAAPIGWLQVTADRKPDVMRSHRIRYSDGRFIHGAALDGHTVPAIAFEIARLRGEEAKFEITPDAVLVAAADKIKADVLITRRRGLQALSSNLLRGLTIIDVVDALSLGGLFLRSRGEYFQAMSPRTTVSCNKAGFFEASALLFLPDQIEILDRSQLLAVDRNERDTAGLAIAAFRRISRSIERRDQIWRLINQPQNVDVAEDMLALIEALLTSLMGALDASARLAHLVYRLPGEVHFVGWQKKDWSKALRNEAPQLWEAVHTKPGHLALLKVLPRLRNAIHSEGLESVTVQESDQHVATWIEIPRKDGQDIADAASGIAPLIDWGIQRVDTGIFFADPGRLMELLIASVLDFLADVQTVLVEQLRTLTETPAPRRSPTLKVEAVARSHRALLGLKGISAR